MELLQELENMQIDMIEIRKMMTNGITIINRDNIYTSERELNLFLELEMMFIHKENKESYSKTHNNYGEFSPEMGIRILDNNNNSPNNKKRTYMNIMYTAKAIDPLTGKMKEKETTASKLGQLVEMFNNPEYCNNKYTLLCSDIEDMMNAERWHQLRTLVLNKNVNFIFLTTNTSKFPSYIRQSAYMMNYSRLFGNWNNTQINCINSFNVIANKLEINDDTWYNKIVSQLIHINSDILDNLKIQLDNYSKDIIFKSKVVRVKDNKGNDTNILNSIKKERAISKITIDGFKNMIDAFLSDYWKNVSILSNLEYEPDNSVDIEELGGYTRLKNDADVWKTIFAHRKIAEECKTPIPKSILLQGPQGTGKTTIAKGIAKKINSKFITFNIANQFSSYLGETENNIKNTLHTLEKMAPAVVLIDEADKVLVGKDGSGKSDSGTTSRALQNLSGFMADDHPGIFFILTANDATKIPPEFLRAGRMDEIYFVSLPDKDIKLSILEIHMKKLGYNAEVIKEYRTTRGENFHNITNMMTGSEIENALKKTRMKHFKKLIGDVPSKDINNVLNSDFAYKVFETILKEATPIAKTYEKEIKELVEWGNKFAIDANKK